MKGRTVLVVDDEPVVRALVAAALEDFRVLQAADGLEGLDVAAREMPDVVLLDIAMPRLNGFEVCRRLKEGVAPRSSVLLLTGLDAQSQAREARRAGADGFVTKPFSPSGLNEAVERALAA